jgi:acetyl-CoA carboxylase biotin carboxylase subunit
VSFGKILIANRGEIAVRILRACRDLGIPAVVAYSEADRETLAVRMADEAVCIGPAEARKSYLNQPAVVSAALITGCDAIHPGYGFLSEDAGFAEVVAAHDLRFIGPRAEVLERFASKYAVRRMLAANGLPTVPGSRGIVTDLDDALAQAQEAGYPVLLKPSAGGGGRGMRLVRSPREMETSLPLSRSEAQAAFGDDSVYFEKWIEESRHVEVQVLIDQHGNGIHLGERDCSVQRRHQKIIEEAPSPAMAESSRERLHDLAIRSVTAAGYESAGTLEFLLDADGNFYFIEINCRVQVEHPVTEMLTGVDLITEQIRLAAGEPLSIRQDEVALRGHAIEFRVNAEDPNDNFSPQTGVVEELNLPAGPGVRVDTHIFPGYEVPPFYDSLLAKLIVWGPDRPSAIARSRRALAEFHVDGVLTNLPFHRGIVTNDAFLNAEVSTNLLDRVGPGAFVSGGTGGGDR